MSALHYARFAMKKSDRMRALRRAERVAQQCCARCICAVALVSICTFSARAAEGPASPPGDHQQQLERAFSALQQADEQIPATSYDPVAVVKSVEGRPDDLFAWVRDNTRWVPYHGALRGAQGVLIDRLGNSLDRSLLLAEFYRHTPISVRLAHAKLSPAQVQELLGKLQSAPRPPGVSFAVTKGAGPNGEAAAQRLERMGETIVQRASAESKALAAALPAAAAPPATDADVEACLADHWWLQRQDGSNWVDLDVTLPGAKPGDTIAPAAETMPVDRLPAELWHSLRITVVTERWADGKLTESRPLSRSVRPGMVVGQTIFLTHRALDWSHSPSIGKSPEDVQKAMAQALTPTEWVPALQLGIEVAIDAGINTDGSLDPKPKLDATARTGGGVGKSAGGAASAFDSAFGDAPKPAAPPPGVFTAEWVEYTLHAPGAADRVIRREVFDLIGPAARAAGVRQRPAPADLDRANAALALHGRIDIIALPCQPSPQFVGHVLLSWFTSAKQAIEQSVAAMHTPGGGQAEISGPAPCPAPLYGIALARRLFSPSAEDWYIAQTNVFTFHSFDRLTGDGHQAYCQATDLVTNDVALEPGSKADPMKVRLDHGVLDTVAEAALLLNSANVTSASDTLFAAAGQPAGWTVVRTAAEVDRLQLPADDMARIRAAVSAGRVAVLPAAPVKIGDRQAVAWWLIDPASGSVLGMADHGWGPSLGEYVKQLELTVIARQRVICLGATVMTVFNNVVAPLFQLSELGGDAGNAAQTALAALCLEG